MGVGVCGMSFSIIAAKRKAHIISKLESQLFIHPVHTATQEQCSNKITYSSNNISLMQQHDVIMLKIT